MITSEHLAELDEVLALAVENDDVLSDWERDFVSDFVNRLEEHQEKIKISPKQQAILDRVAEKLRKAGIL